MRSGENCCGEMPANPYVSWANGCKLCVLMMVQIDWPINPSIKLNLLKINFSDYFFYQSEPSSSSSNAGGLEEVTSTDPIVMKSTSLSSLDSGHENIQDLHVQVQDPEKHIEGYVSYNVVTKVCIVQVFHYIL